MHVPLQLGRGGYFRSGPRTVRGLALSLMAVDLRVGWYWNQPNQNDVMLGRRVSVFEESASLTNPFSVTVHRAPAPSTSTAGARSGLSSCRREG